MAGFWEGLLITSLGRSQGTWGGLLITFVESLFLLDVSVTIHLLSACKLTILCLALANYKNL
jgi:hypothetical protein